MEGKFKGLKDKDIEWAPETIIENSFIVNNLSNKLHKSPISSISKMHDRDENLENYIEKRK